MLKFNDKSQTLSSCCLVTVAVRPPPLFPVFGTGGHLEPGQGGDGGLRALELYKSGKHDKAICRAPSLLRN